MTTQIRNYNTIGRELLAEARTYLDEEVLLLASYPSLAGWGALWGWLVD